MAIEDEVLLNLEAEDKSVEKTTKQVIEAMQELDSTIKKLTSSFNSFNNSSSNINKNNKKTADSTDKVISSMNKYRIAGLGVGKVLKDWTLEAAEAYGVQTRFNSLFDKTNGELAEAKRWVNEWSDALYLDSIEVENVASKFRLLTQTMGVNNSKSLEMTQNMTKLSYDLAAVTGHQEDISTTMNAINSALAGQTKALAKYGIALNQNSLQETLNTAGINKKVSALNSAEKAELIYTQIMRQSAGMQGYYAKTLMSPANAANIVKTQFSMLAREIGNVFIPILMALVPIVISVTKALRTLAKAIAGFFGISMDFDAYEKGFDGISAGIGSVGDKADETSGKVKNMIRDFDNLHVVDFDTGAGGVGDFGGGGGGGSLFDPIEYADWSGALDGIMDKFGWLKDIIAGIAIGLAAWKISKLFMKDALEALSTFDKIRIAAGAIVLSIGAMTILSGIKENDLKKKLLGILEAGAGTGLMFKSWKAGVLAMEIAAVLTLAISMVKWTIENYNDVKKGIYGDIEKLTLGQKINVGMSAMGQGALNELVKAMGYDPMTFEQWGQAFNTYFSNVEKGYTQWIDGLTSKALGFETTWKEFHTTVTDPSAWEQYWTQVKAGAEQWKNDTLGIWEAFKEVTGQKLSEAGESLKTKFEEMKTNAGNKLTELKDGAIQKWEELKSNIRTKIEEIKTNVTNKFIEIKTNVTDKVDEVKTNVTTKFESIKKTITDKIEGARDAVKNAIEKIKGFFNFEWKLPDIKLPHFGIDWDANGVVGEAFQKLGMPGLPKLRVDWYATGGFPDKGDLFIANEREPELIGSMGNRSVVANNAQITEGIAQASYSAFKQALQEMRDSFGGDTLVYVGDTQITDIVTKKKNIRDKRFGR